MEVWADWVGLGAPTRVGTLTAQVTRGREIASFEYDRAWLTGPRVQIDPHLPLFEGRHHPKPPLSQFGVFADASPDRWGRTLLVRREARLARMEDRARRTLMPLDFLLGVHDGHRLGGLRFRLGVGPFLDDDDRMAAPPWTSLGELEHASRQLEREGVEDDPSYGHWLAMLIAPGASLGGARPKASVVDHAGQLWMAKFPSANDEDDVGAWEAVAQELGARAGVIVAEARAQRFGGTHHTYLSRRFDRVGTRRLHFSSAMTQLGQADGRVEPDIGYLDIAEFLAREGAEPGADMAQLWRRVVFSVCVSNTDDHLRNHGFLWTPSGWRLSPAYDVNPSLGRTELSLPYDGASAELDLDLVRDAAEVYRVSEAEADTIVDEVRDAVGQWRAVAGELGISRAEQERMESAFRAADASA